MCRETKPLTEFYRKKAGWRFNCKACSRKSLDALGRPTAQHKRHIELKRGFGISGEEYDRLFSAQDLRCAICRRMPRPDERAFPLDHDHATGAIRGVLCVYCNTRLGALQDEVWLSAAVAYLEAPPACSILGDRAAPSSSIRAGGVLFDPEPYRRAA
jgi:hypothetical protein